MKAAHESDYRPRVVVDTSVLVSGIAGFKKPDAIPPYNLNANLIRKWVNNGHFVWLYSEDITDEYCYVLGKRGVRKAVIGRLMNLLREEGEEVIVKRQDALSPHYTDNALCACAITGAADYIVTNNVRHFPQEKLRAKVISPGSPIVIAPAGYVPLRMSDMAPAGMTPQEIAFFFCEPKL